MAFKPRLFSLFLIISLACLGTLNAQTLKLDKGEQICLVGNALGERMQHQNYWETLLHGRFADKQLAVRNLCFPGDEPSERIRSQNFGDINSHLEHSKATTVLFFFGFNQSFHGEKGLADYRESLKKLVEEVKSHDYSGKGSPKIVLVSPIAFEKTNHPHLPNGREHNPRLELYTNATQQVAEETKVGFADIFRPTLELFAKSETQLTLNGAHLNAAGYRALAPIMMNALFGNGENKYSNEVHAAIDDKNFHWWHRYRAVNGLSIYGQRGTAGFDGTYRNRDVMERERAILDQMTANRDARIWTIASGKKVAGPIDDSNTLPFLNVKTNVGGEDDPNRKRGKLGSLDYQPGAKQLKQFRLAPGYEINLFASEEQFPELANPVSLNFDNRGRLWVSTMASYPHWKPKTKMDDKPQPSAQ